MARPRSAAQRSALRKAQLASARARRGTGKAKPVGKRRKAAAPKPKAIRRRATPTSATKYNYKQKASKAAVSSHNRRKKIIKRAGIAAVAVGAVGGAAYTYKNRERLIVVPMAERRFIKEAEKKKGRKLKPGEKRHIAMRERRLHARRSVDAARMYLEARKFARSFKGQSINPASEGYALKGTNINPESARYIFEIYRKDVNARARHRLNKIKGKKTSGFGYNSGKQVKVTKSGKVVRQIW